MKKFFILLGLISFLFLSACNEEKKQELKGASQELKSDSSSMILMSQNTNIKAAEYLTAEIKIPTVVCGMCRSNIKKAVSGIEGIVETKVDIDKKIAVVKYDGIKTNPERIRMAISKAGYDADDVKRDSSAYDKLDDCCKIENKKHS